MGAGGRFWAEAMTDAIILCGGRSARMGRPKALLELAGLPLIVRVCAAAAEVADDVVVVSSAGLDLPPLPDVCRVVLDREDYAGPLVGLCRGSETLEKASGHTFVCGCDYPFLTGRFLSGLLSLAGEAEVTSLSGDGPQPLCAWYRTETFGRARTMCASGERRLTAFYDQLQARVVDHEELAGLDPERATINVNTEEAFERAKRMA